MKRSSFNVLFFLKKTKLLKNGEASVCMRVCQNTLLITEDRYIAELSYEVAI